MISLAQNSTKGTLILVTKSEVQLSASGVGRTGEKAQWGSGNLEDQGHVTPLVVGTISQV